MSLEITTTNGSKQQHKLENRLPPDFYRITESVYADGEELTKIKNQYRLNNTSIYFSIPIVKNAKQMTWIGDIAKTIVANLDY